jgi:hypothetical protein
VFEFHVFLTDCFIQRPMKVRSDLILTPVEGPGSADIASVMNRFGVERLGQTEMPDHVKATQAQHGSDKRSVVVVSFLNLEGNDRREAMLSTRGTVMAIQDALALVQLTRGELGGFYVVRTDCDPMECYVEPRPPSTRRIYKLGPGQEEDIIWAAIEEALSDPLVAIYLSLYADIVRSDDGLRPQMTLEAKLTKVWTLLETMANLLPRHVQRNPPRGATGDKDVDKVAALYCKYEMGIGDITSDDGPLSILQVAYKLRGVFVHSGSCQVATRQEDRRRCERWGGKLPEIVDALESDCGRLIQSYIASQLKQRHGDISFSGNDQLTTVVQVTSRGEGQPAELVEIPGVAALARRKG